MQRKKTTYLQQLNESKQLDREEKIWAVEKSNIERRNKIKQERKKLKHSGGWSSLAMSKKILIIVFINCIIIEIFTGIIIIKAMALAALVGTTADLSPLLALIPAVGGQVGSLISYNIKSQKENTEGGITYLNAQQQYEQGKYQAETANISTNNDGTSGGLVGDPGNTN